MIETTKYTEGYTTESLVLPYPWQTDLPDTTAERFEAVKQWVSLVTQSLYASQMLRDAWLEEQRKAAVTRVEKLDAEHDASGFVGDDRGADDD